MRAQQITMFGVPERGPKAEQRALFAVDSFDVRDLEEGVAAIVDLGELVFDHWIVMSSGPAAVFVNRALERKIHTRGILEAWSKAARYAKATGLVVLELVYVDGLLGPVLVARFRRHDGPHAVAVGAFASDGRPRDVAISDIK